jgi:hypothetical protein
MQRRVVVGLSAAAALLLGSTALAEVGVGDSAPMFETVNEDMQPIDMADYIDGKPLAMCVGSAS